jgi:uncharacterized protein YndB with AHSA1/START domain
MTDAFAVLTPTGDTASVHLIRDFATDAADLWDAVSTPERVSRWFARVEGDFGVGKGFTLHFDDGTADFEIVDCAPPTGAAVRWLKADGSSLVTVAVTPTGKSTSRLVLDHVEVPLAAAAGYATGWHWHLSGLRVQLEGDAVVRQPWDELAAHYNAVLAPV